MNRVHNVICSSRRWTRHAQGELLPWALEGVDPGEDVLEIGPGFGTTTEALTAPGRRLTALELDESYCRRLRARLGGEVEVVQGDATELPFADGRFSGVLCFTMLHHIPDARAQDRLLAESRRVLRPGGTFAGSDSLGAGLMFRLIHVGDTLLPLDPDTLPARLRAAGLSDPRVDVSGGSMRFRAVAA